MITRRIPPAIVTVIMATPATISTTSEAKQSFHRTGLPTAGGEGDEAAHGQQERQHEGLERTVAFRHAHAYPLGIEIRWGRMPRFVRKCHFRKKSLTLSLNRYRSITRNTTSGTIMPMVTMRLMADMTIPRTAKITPRYQMTLHPFRKP